MSELNEDVLAILEPYKALTDKIEIQLEQMFCLGRIKIIRILKSLTEKIEQFDEIRSCCSNKSKP